MAERINTAINDWFSQGHDDSGELNTGDDGVYSGDEIADTDYSYESGDTLELTENQLTAILTEMQVGGTDASTSLQNLAPIAAILGVLISLYAVVKD